MAKKISAVSATGTATLEQLILKAINDARQASINAKDVSGKAHAAREVIRDYYKNLKTRPVLLAVIETITDAKLKVWTLKIATYVKPEPKAVDSKFASITRAQFMELGKAKGWIK